MTDPLAFLVAVLALLAAPGPTNALLAAAGAGRGVGAAVAAVPAAVAGYLIAIAALVTLAGPAVAASPVFAAGLKLAAGLLLIRAAWKLWRSGGIGAGPLASAPGAGAVFATTLINPKSLVFAFAILPPRPLPEIAPHLAIVALSVALVSLGWIAAGALLAGGSGRMVTPARICRARPSCSPPSRSSSGRGDRRPGVGRRGPLIASCRRTPGVSKSRLPASPPRKTP